MKRIVLLTVVLFLLAGITASAELMLSQKEDIYRADKYVTEETKYTGWLCDDGAFVYVRQANLKEEDYVNYICNKAFDGVDFTDALLSGDFSRLMAKNSAYRTAMKEIILSLVDSEVFESYDTVKENTSVELSYEYLDGMIEFASNTAEINEMFSNIDDIELRAFAEEYGILKNHELLKAFAEEYDIKDLDPISRAYMDSEIFAERIGGMFDYVDLLGDVIDIAKYSYDAFIELESFDRYDEQYIEFIRNMYLSSTSEDMRAVTGELLTKLTATYEKNYADTVSQCYNKIVLTGGEFVLGEIVDMLAEEFLFPNLCTGAKFGITAGKLWSNYWYNTNDIREALLQIRACEELGYYLTREVNRKTATYKSYFGSYEGKARLANDLIFYYKLLYSVRERGENAFYSLKNLAYDAGDFAYYKQLGFFNESLEEIDEWYKLVQFDLLLTRQHLFSNIDRSLYEDLYEYPVSKDEFVISNGVLLEYNGSDGDVYVPYSAREIAGGAFTAEPNMSQVCIRGKILRAEAFLNCTYLYAAYIPESVTVIENNAFSGCPNVVFYGYRGSAAEEYANNNGIEFITLNTESYDGAEYADSMVLREGTLNLNGKTLYVGGDLIHAGGELYLGDGKLVVYGNYYLTSEDTAEASNGYLRMAEADGHLLVHGDFVMDSAYDHYRLLYEGVLEIKGDFVQRSSKTAYNFRPSSNHKVVFSGSKTQSISFETPENSYFFDVEFVNHDINFATPIRGWNLKRDTEINGDLEIKYGTLSLEKYSLTINGDLNHTGGELYLSSGRLTVDNYYLASADRSEAVSANLFMTNEGSHFLVKGDFLTYSANSHYNCLYNGVLEIKGNFTQKAGRINNFCPSSNHKVVFSGSKTQNISFATPEYSYFADVEFVNPNINFATPIQGWNLKRDTEINGDLEIKCGKLNMNGYDLTINGDLLHTGGEIYVGKKLTVNNYYLSSADKSGPTNATLYMGNDNAHFLVLGDFYTCSSNSGYGAFHRGVLEIKGDFTQGEGSRVDSFAPTESHKVVFSGSLQTVSFASPNYSSFKDLELSSDSNACVIFATQTNITGELIQSGGMKITNPENLIGNNELLDLGVLNDAVNEYTGDACGVIPTRRNHKRYRNSLGCATLGTSLLLDGSIGVKQYIHLTQSNYVVDVSVYCGDELVSKERMVPTYDSHSELYSITVYVAPKDAEDAVIKCTVANTGDVLDDVSVTAYTEGFRELAKTDGEYASALDLIDSLERYAQYCRRYFSGEDMEDLDVEIDVMPTASRSGDFAGVRHIATSLLLEGRTTVRHYFETDGKKHTFALGDVALTPTDLGDGVVCVDISDISADRLDEVYVLSVDGASYVSYSALDYIAQATDSEDERLSRLAKALYLYWCAAEEYTK